MSQLCNRSVQYHTGNTTQHAAQSGPHDQSVGLTCQVEQRFHVVTACRVQREDGLCRHHHCLARLRAHRRRGQVAVDHVQQCRCGIAGGAAARQLHALVRRRARGHVGARYRRPRGAAWRQRATRACGGGGMESTRGRKVGLSVRARDATACKGTLPTSCTLPPCRSSSLESGQLCSVCPDHAAGTHW